MKRKSRDISSYFKKKITVERDKEMTGDQQRASEKEEKEEVDGGKQQIEQHDEETESAIVDSDEEKHQAAEQEQSAPLISETWQDSAKAGVPGPTGEVMTMWP